MGLRFRKSIKIAPGVKLNFNKKSTGITFGGKGMHYTINSKGKRTKSVGIPETGLSYSTTSFKRKSNKKSNSNITSGYTEHTLNPKNFNNKENKNMSNKKWYQKTWVIILLLIYFFPVGIYLMWKHTAWKKGVKVAITAVWAFYLGLFALGFSLTDSENIAQPTTYSESTTEFLFAEATTETTTEITTETTTESTTEVTVIITTEAETEYSTEKFTEDYSEAETTEVYSDDEYYYVDEYEEETYENENDEEEYYEDEEESEMVWVTATGSKYHSIPDCGNTKSSRQVTLEIAQRTCSPCSKCW